LDIIHQQCEQGSISADGATRHAASRPSRCTQSWMVSVIR